MSKYLDHDWPEEMKSWRNYRSLRTCFEKLPEIVQFLTIDGGNYTYSSKYRGLQKLYGDKVLVAIANLCNKKKTPGRYFAKITSKTNLERTLIYVKRLLLRSVEAMSYVANKIGNKTQKFMNYIGDKIADGKYSMAEVVKMVEIAEKKRSPDRYLIGILKKGFAQ